MDIQPTRANTTTHNPEVDADTDVGNDADVNCKSPPKSPPITAPESGNDEDLTAPPSGDDVTRSRYSNRYGNVGQSRSDNTIKNLGSLGDLQIGADSLAFMRACVETQQMSRTAAKERKTANFTQQINQQSSAAEEIGKAADLRALGGYIKGAAGILAGAVTIGGAGSQAAIAGVGLAKGTDTSSLANAAGQRAQGQAGIITSAADIASTALEQQAGHADKRKMLHETTAKQYEEKVESDKDWAEQTMETHRMIMQQANDQEQMRTQTSVSINRS